MKSSDAAIRKRTQIAKANRTMFIWISIASVVVGVAAVVSYFLFNNLAYTEKVLAEKQTTLSTLNSNNNVVAGLADEIRVLDTNSALSSVKAKDTDQAIQVILDALPSEANSFALGASLQNKLLAGVSGLDGGIESLQVDPVVGVETLTGSTATTTAQSAAGTENAITFRFKVRGGQPALRQVLENLEKSIRTIVVTNVRIETQRTGPEMTVEGKAFYEPTTAVKLENKVVPR
ncbi:MAG: GspMb/PilO family protein [Candidatus Microsaccharimonas sp.]